MKVGPLTLWREARGEGSDGMLGVYCVILNRARNDKRWPDDPEEVCLEPYQFTCWNNNDSQRKLYPGENDTSYIEAERIWAAGYPDEDPTRGATFYRNVKTAGPYPAGQYRVTVQIGNHTFAVAS